MKNHILDSKIWLTGASSGIGQSLLLLLLQQGANVIASSRNITELLAIKQQYPEKLTLIACDVSNPDAVKKCIEEIALKFNCLDKVILNAGNCYYLDMPNFKSDIIRKNFEVNFFGMINCIEASLPLLLKSNAPHLIGMSSAAAYLPIPRAEGYGSSKAAVLYLLRCLQFHQQDNHLDVSIICPGFVKTPLTDKNDFAMPFIISADTAAQYILKGIIKRKLEISFPKKLIWAFKLIAIMPAFLRKKFC